MRLPVFVFLTGCILLAGCNSAKNDPIAPAVYDPSAAAEQAFATYDSNKDGFLDATELDASPGLKAALPKIDKDRDRKIAREELQKRLEQYQSLGAGAVGYSVRVTFNGSPLADAEVKFVPAPFLKENLKEATAKTAQDGTANAFKIGEDTVPGLPPGLYAVQVTKPDGPAIPEQFNTKTTLGCEVFGGERGESATLDLRLSGR